MDSKEIVESKSNKSSLIDDPITVLKKFKSGQNKIPWLTYACGLTANLLLICTGMSNVWTSPVVPKITSNDTIINPLGSPVSVAQISIIAALCQIATPIGLVLTAKLSDSLGRKKTLMMVAIVFICNVFLVAFGTHIYCYYIFSVISGFCTSIIVVCVPVYNNEIAEDGNRGKIGCLMGLGMPTGNLLAYLFGPITSVKGFMLTFTVPACFYLIFSIIIPESPIFLAMRGRKLECIKSLEKLRSSKSYKDVEIEYDKIETTVKIKNKTKSRFLDIFRKRAPRKAFLIGIGIYFVQQFSGIFVLLGFTATIFEKSGRISGDSFGIIVGALQLIVFVVAAFIIDTLGRKLLLLVSSLTCSIALFILAIYFYLQSIKSPLIDSMYWLPILGISVYITGYGLGLGPVPIALVGELFPNNLRATGIASIIITNDIVLFINMLCFPLITDSFGIEYCLWFFSTVCVLGFFFMLFNLPETKGKSFLEIQEILKR